MEFYYSTMDQYVNEQYLYLTPLKITYILLKKPDAPLCVDNLLRRDPTANSTTGLRVLSNLILSFYTDVQFLR